jgi:hypothetical protein
MNYFTAVLILLLCLCSGNVIAQIQILKQSSHNADPSQLEGVTIKNGNSSMLVLSNVTIQKSSANFEKAAVNNQVIAPTILKKVGNYEIHKVNPNTANQVDLAQGIQNLMIQGKIIPTFREAGTGQDFLGAVYLFDVQKLGLISKEIAVRFKTGYIPTQFNGLGAKEIIKSSGLYVFQVNDIYAWLNLVSSLQADYQVNLVEPHIVTEFDKPN